MRWGQHAVTAYLAGAAGIDTPAVTAVPHFWVARQTNTPMTWEMYAWGRRYESPDGMIRELRLIRLGAADDGHRAPANVAIAAFSIAFGVPAVWPERWEEPFRPANGLRAYVQRVRVLEVGLQDGSHVVLFDGTPRQAEALYTEHARARVRGITAGGTPLPGIACADCKLVMAWRNLIQFLTEGGEDGAQLAWTGLDGFDPSALAAAGGAGLATSVMLADQQISEVELSLVGAVRPASSPGVPVDVVWPGDVVDVLSPEVTVLGHELAARGVPAPRADQIGYELGDQAWQAELAWPARLAAVIAPGPEDSDCIAAYSAAGWDARLPDGWPPDELARRILGGDR